MEKETTYHCLSCGLINKYKDLKKKVQSEHEWGKRYINICPECESHRFAIYSDVTDGHFIK